MFVYISVQFFTLSLPLLIQRANLFPISFQNNKLALVTHSLFLFIIFLFSFVLLKIGLLLLCATGNLHVSWTIWQLLMYVFDYENTETDILIAWFLGAAGGALLGAVLNANWSKILIYVSKKNPVLFVYVVRLLYFMSIETKEGTVVKILA